MGEALRVMEMTDEVRKRPVVEIVEMTAAHVRKMGDILRPGDRHEIEILGFPTNKALWYSYKISIMRRAAFVDGELAAIWGVGGSLMGAQGQPWLMTSDAVHKISPLRFARIYQDEVHKMLKVFPKLVNYVDASYTMAVRLLDIVGFKLGDPQPIGKVGGLFRKFEIEA